MPHSMLQKKKDAKLGDYYLIPADLIDKVDSQAILSLPTTVPPYYVKEAQQRISRQIEFLVPKIKSDTNKMTILDIKNRAKSGQTINELNALENELEVEVKGMVKPKVAEHTPQIKQKDNNAVNPPFDKRKRSAAAALLALMQPANIEPVQPQSPQIGESKTDRLPVSNSTNAVNDGFAKRRAAAALMQPAKFVDKYRPNADQNVTTNFHSIFTQMERGAQRIKEEQPTKNIQNTSKSPGKK